MSQSPTPSVQYTTPTTLVIFGVTGDLSQRKLIPAFLDLYEKRLLPPTFRIVGFSRAPHTEDSFHEFLNGAITKRGYDHPAVIKDEFLKQTCYVQGFFDDPKSYERLAESLIAIDREVGQCSNKLFYLATPPTLYKTIFENLAHSGLTISCAGETGWTRILVEKPFGNDLHTAQDLDVLLGLLFKEEQIFRIDHYLAKETIQNILAFRFSNSIFEPVWNTTYIEKVEITLWEGIGIEERGVFYDATGALRDVGQNHLLQMLALIAMNDPGTLDASSIRNERATILNTLQAPTPEQFGQFVERGQYQGYRGETGIKSDSETETFFRITAFLKNKRWSNVPFILESGKKMPETKTEITIHFKEIPSCICIPGREQIYQNRLTFRIQPNEGISILFWAKKPGFTMELEPQLLSFSYKQGDDMRLLPDAYEKILYDCIRGDQMLFASTDEMNAAWRFVTPILEQWDRVSLKIY